jgi:nucleotide-binding universal stress UspA family protein
MEMQKQIIVPLDGSRLAEHALPHAVALAGATGSGLTLLQVVPITPATTPIIWGVPVGSIGPDYHEALVASAQGYLQSIAQEIGREGLTPQSEVLTGEAAEAIITHTEQQPEAAMIVMSTRGRSGLSRWVFGSVAEKVLEAAPVPLALIRPAELPADEDGVETSALVPPGLGGIPAIPRYRTVLVPLDGSARAEAALEHASALAVATGASILLVSVMPLPYNVVLPPLPTAAPAGDPSDDEATLLLPPRQSIQKAFQELYEREKLALTGYLASAARHIGYLGKAEIVVRTRILEGDAGSEILRASREEGADLIVMSTRGEGGPARLWPGSVAMKVVREAALPVLLVPAQRSVPVSS